MKVKNQVSKPLLIAILLLGIFSCAGGKDTIATFEQEPPFTLGTVFYQDWVAGVQEAGSGTNVHVRIKSVTEEVEMLHIYFRNKIEKAQNSPQYVDQYVGYFKNKARPDVIMDGEPIKEAQNTPPESFPFRLADDEAVLSYELNNEVKYVKLSNMERRPMIAYPGVNKTDEEH